MGLYKRKIRLGLGSGSEEQREKYMNFSYDYYLWDLPWSLYYQSELGVEWLFVLGTNNLT